MNNIVRKPTDTETALIAKFLVDNNFDIDYEIYSEILELKCTLETITYEQKIQCAIALLNDYFVNVVENYESDCPGYNGTVFIILWGEVCFVSMLGYEDKEQTRLCNLSDIEQVNIGK